MSIGKNIKYLREKNNMNQNEFGKLFDVTDKAVSTWENDIKIPRMGTIQKIADYFSLTKSQIIEDELYNKKKYENIKVYDEDDRPYVLDDEALALIDSLRTRPEMKILFSVSKKATKDDILKTVKIIEALKNNEE